MKTFQNFDLTNYNSYRIQASCANAFFPENEEDIRYVFQQRTDVRKVLIGSGHNIILAKDHYEEDFIIFADTFNHVSVRGDVIEAEASTTMLTLSMLALEHRLSGLEIFYDIPSSLGGAIVMNAGAGGEEIKDVLLSVRYYDPALDVFGDISKEEINFEYRNSFFQRNPRLIVTKATLQLTHGNPLTIVEKMEMTKAARWAKQPKDHPNAGSVFKRPPGRFVGPMIDELGLKGHAHGGAKVSEKHSGFIINYNQATGHDIISLITDVKSRVLEKFGVDLEVEQRII